MEVASRGLALFTPILQKDLHSSVTFLSNKILHVLHQLDDGKFLPNVPFTAQGTVGCHQSMCHCDSCCSGTRFLRPHGFVDGFHHRWHADGGRRLVIIVHVLQLLKAIKEMVVGETVCVMGVHERGSKCPLLHCSKCRSQHPCQPFPLPRGRNGRFMGNGPIRWK